MHPNTPENHEKSVTLQFTIKNNGQNQNLWTAFD